jgi:NACHT domain
MDPVTQSVLTKTVGLVGEYLKKKFVDQPAHYQYQVDLPTHLHKRMTEVLNWSNEYQLLGMAAPASIDDRTIEITLSTEPRSFAAKGNTGRLSEEDLISGPTHYIILGDPGSGKTTTIKRLIRRMLLTAPASSNDSFQYPVLVRLRTLVGVQSLVAAIADFLGIKYRVTGSIDPDNKKLLLHVGDKLLEDVVAEVLNETQALLFLDGLDEVDLAYRQSIRDQIHNLRLKMSESKIIASCRAGDFFAHIESFSTVELRPLAKAQIKQISKLWLADPEPFLVTLENMPCADLADRPLLLIELILLFKRYGYLPEQPSVIYEKLIRLMLEDWDSQRSILRTSKYSGFTADRKLAFLAALSYQLTYVRPTKVFSEKELVAAYEAVKESFGLPANEARQVAREIQSHTGLIVASGPDSYEFTHLSLQEYLCAFYLVRDPFAERMIDYIARNPAPIAVAISIAADPSKWLAALLLKSPTFTAFQPGSAAGLISRLMIERPSFSTSALLGTALMRLYHSAEFAWRSPELQTLLDRFVEDQGVLKSVEVAMKMYAISLRKSTAKAVWFVRIEGFAIYGGFEIPSVIAAPTALVASILERSSGIKWIDNDNSLKESMPELLTKLKQMTAKHYGQSTTA